MTVLHVAPTEAKPFAVLSSAEKMPSSVMKPYRRIAIIETDGIAPAIITTRSSHVKNVVREYRRLSDTGRRTAFVRALAEAVELATWLNEQHAKVAV
jgi:hypothetical protein